MIRRLLLTTYRRTAGALFGALWKSATTVGARVGALQFVYVLIVVGLMAGFVNAVVLPVSNQGQPIYQAAGAQTIPETFIDAMVILLGASGIYLTYISGRQTTKSRMVNMYLGVAIMLIAVSVLMGLYLISLKP